MLVNSPTSDELTPDAEPSLLEMRGVVSAARSCDAVLDFTVCPGESVAVVGAKASTVLDLVTGSQKPIAGSIARRTDRRGRHAVALGENPPSVGAAVSIRALAGDSLPDSTDPDMAGRFVRSVLHRLGFVWDESSDRLVLESTLDVARFTLAEAVVARPNLIVANEPFEHLPASQRFELLGSLLAYQSRRSAVVVATNRQAVADLCDRIVRLEAPPMLSEASKAG